MRNKKKSKADVAIVMGSKSDLKTMNEAAKSLDLFGITYTINILSAHRTPRDVAQFASSADQLGYKIIIAGAGGAAHLPGMIAAETILPVIGVPVATTMLKGIDSLFSIVQMPKGIPVATVAIENAWNAGVLASQILSLIDPLLAAKILNYKKSMEKKVRSQKIK